MSVNRRVAGAGFVSVTLGALGCGGPSLPEPVRPQELFRQDASSTDSLRGEGWRKYLSAGALHAAWAPPSGSPWRAYYKPTLVAAVSIVESAARPVRASGAEAEEALAERFARTVASERAAIFVDLDGEASVAWSVVLARAGYQPVVTFNNWPHQRGLLPLERPLGALLYYAGERAEVAKSNLAPPVFALERHRLSPIGGGAAGSFFDNRYFHAVSDFPSAAQLKAASIDRVYYVSLGGNAPAVEADDLNAYFLQLFAGGIRFRYVAATGSLLEVRDVPPAARQTIFTAAETRQFASFSPYGRSYSHYSYFWSSSRSTWGSSSSGGGGWSGLSSG